MLSALARIGLLVLVRATAAEGIIFRLDANGQQCISEDAGSDEVLVYVQYNVTRKPGDQVQVSLQVWWHIMRQIVFDYVT